MQKVVSKLWGHELWIVNNPLYCGKQLTVLPTKWCSVHAHVNKVETFYILEGSLLLQYASSDSYEKLNEAKKNKTDKELLDFWNRTCRTIGLFEGDSFDVDRLSYHRFTTSENIPCNFIEFSTEHKDEDSYRLIESV